MCAGREFQVEGADTEKARGEKLLETSGGLVRRFVLEEHKKTVRNEFRQVESLRGVKCFPGGRTQAKVGVIFFILQAASALQHQLGDAAAATNEQWILAGCPVYAD